MNYIKEFNEGNIGLDYKHSSEKALKELSRLSLLHEDVSGQCHSVYSYIENLGPQYKCVLYDQEYNSYNAFGAEVAAAYLANHLFMTAEQILGTPGLNIDEIENDVIELLSGE